MRPLCGCDAVISVDSSRQDRMQEIDGVGSPAVVVVAVDVEDLLALDTKHAVTRPTHVSFMLLVGTIDSLDKLDRIYPERMHSVRPVTKPLSSAKIQQHLQYNDQCDSFVAERFEAGTEPHIAGLKSADIPVPSTMTSYSLAISSMVASFFLARSMVRLLSRRSSAEVKGRR